MTGREALNEAYKRGKREGRQERDREWVESGADRTTERLAADHYERGRADGAREAKRGVLDLMDRVTGPPAVAVNYVYDSVYADLHSTPQHPPRARSESGQPGGEPVTTANTLEGLKRLRPEHQVKAIAAMYESAKGSLETLRFVREAWDEYARRPSRTLHTDSFELIRKLNRILNPRPEPEPDE